MSLRNEIWQEIAEEIWLKYELEIFFRLKADGGVHGNNIYQIRRRMEGGGCDQYFAERFIQTKFTT